MIFLMLNLYLKKVFFSNKYLKKTMLEFYNKIYSYTFCYNK